MKHAWRPVYSILFLLVLAGTLAVRVAFRGYGSFQLKYEEPTLQTHQKPFFNKTLLEYAAIDIDEPRLKQEIQDLLDGKYSDRGQKRSFLTAGKYVRARPIKGVPFMVRTPEFYRFWLTFRRYLGDWSRNRRFQSDVMSDLADEVKVLIDEYNGKNGTTGKYRSCAVVGNSGILLNQDDGLLIDSHEVVIRLNNARTRSFESHVGSKTSISFVNSNILHLCARRQRCFCHPYGENVPMIMYICQPVHFFDYLACNSSHRAPLIITDPKFDVLCARIVKYYSLRRFVELAGRNPQEWAAAHGGANFHYSSGMQAVMLAVGVCDRVSIFGFGKSNLARHHYHTNQKKELSLHDYEAEYDFYRDLMQRPKSIPFISEKFKFPSVIMH